MRIFGFIKQNIARNKVEKNFVYFYKYTRTRTVLVLVTYK